jgi:hypothetical protein
MRKGEGVFFGCWVSWLCVGFEEKVRRKTRDEERKKEEERRRWCFVVKPS